MFEGEVSESLPFSEAKQLAFLGHLLHKPTFFNICRTRAKPHWFVKPAAGLVFKTMLEFYNLYLRSPTQKELEDSKDFLALDQGDRNKCLATISDALHRMQQYGLDVLENELTEWYRSRLYVESMKANVNLYNNTKGAPETYRHLLKSASEIAIASFVEDKVIDFGNFAEDMLKSQQEMANSCTFGHPEMDRLINSECPEGALLRKDTTIIMAPVNQGKTLTCLNIVVENFLKGKDILIVTHEGRPSDITEKIWRRILNWTKAEYYAASTDPVALQKMNTLTPLLKKRLTYCPMQSVGLTVQEVMAAIRMQQERKIATDGKGFDLIFDDYPAILSAMEAVKGNWAPRQIQDLVYRQFVQLAEELDCHVVVPIQTNREGSRINQGEKGTESRLLRMEDVAEAFGPMQAVANVISVNRDPVAQAKGFITFYLAKNRTNQAGTACIVQSDFAKARTHSRGSWSMRYRSSANFSERVEQLLLKHKNQELPPDFNGA